MLGNTLLSIMYIEFAHYKIKLLLLLLLLLLSLDLESLVSDQEFPVEYWSWDWGGMAEVDRLVSLRSVAFASTQPEK